MNWKRFFLAFIAAFIFMFCWGWFYNGALLKDVFAEVQNLFRPREEMMGLFPWIIIGQAGLALSFVMIYASGFARGGIAAGVRLGIMWRFWRLATRCAILCDTTFPGEAARVDKHRWRHRMIMTGVIVGAIYKPTSTRNLSVNARQLGVGR